MSTTEQIIEATVSEDGSATVLIADKTHEFTATSEDAARAEIIALVTAHASELGTPVAAVMNDSQGSWPVKIHPDGTVEPDTGRKANTPKAETTDAPRRRRSQAPATEISTSVEKAQEKPAKKLDSRELEMPPAGEPVAAPVPTTTAKPVPSTATLNSPKPTTMPEVNPTANPFAQKHEEKPEGIQKSAAGTAATRSEARKSFLTQEQVEEPATQGWRGTMTRMGIRMAPSDAERAERGDVQAVSQHWPGPRTIAIVNGKGGAGKTPTTVLLSAIFARYGGAGVLAWDNNQTRGTLGWRTEQGPHEATLLELLPQSETLLGTGAQSADLAHFVHHQTRDRFDVLRSKPMELASAQRVDGEDVDAIHRVASKYYRLIFIDSGNDESDPMWQRMIDHTDQLVVATTTRDDHAEAGALLLEALADRGDKAQTLAQNAVAVVTQADSKATSADVKRVADGYRTLARDVASIPFDPAIVDGILRYDALRPATQRAWLAAGAAVARGL